MAIPLNSSPVLSISEIIDKLLNNNFLSDIVFTFENDARTINAHSFILVARSAVYEKNFDAFHAAYQSMAKSIPIQKYSYDTFLEFLRFIYTDKCDVTVTNVIEILELSVKYKIPKLENLALELITENDWQACETMEIYNFCLTDTYEFLQKWISHLVGVQLADIINSDFFFDIQPDVLEQILAMDYVGTIKNPISELDIFRALIKWMDKYCKKNDIAATERRVTFDKLIRTIRFPLMMIAELNTVVKNTNLMTSTDYVSFFTSSDGELWNFNSRIAYGNLITNPQDKWLSRPKVVKNCADPFINPIHLRTAQPVFPVHYPSLQPPTLFNRPWNLNGITHSVGPCFSFAQQSGATGNGNTGLFGSTSSSVPSDAKNISYTSFGVQTKPAETSNSNIFGTTSGAITGNSVLFGSTSSTKPAETSNSISGAKSNIFGTTSGTTTGNSVVFGSTSSSSVTSPDTQNNPFGFGGIQTKPVEFSNLPQFNFGIPPPPAKIEESSEAIVKSNIFGATSGTSSNQNFSFGAQTKPVESSTSQPSSTTHIFGVTKKTGFGVPEASSTANLFGSTSSKSAAFGCSSGKPPNQNTGTTLFGQQSNRISNTAQSHSSGFKTTQNNNSRSSPKPQSSITKQQPQRSTIPTATIPSKSQMEPQLNYFNFLQPHQIENVSTFTSDRDLLITGLWFIATPAFVTSVTLSCGDNEILSVCLRYRQNNNIILSFGDAIRVQADKPFKIAILTGNRDGLWKKLSASSDDVIRQDVVQRLRNIRLSDRVVQIFFKDTEN